MLHPVLYDFQTLMHFSTIFNMIAANTKEIDMGIQRNAHDQACMLLDSTAEFRLQIYSRFFSIHEHEWFYFSPSADSIYQLNGVPAIVLPINLLLACKKLEEEVKAAFLGSTTFHFIVPDYGTRYRLFDIQPVLSYHFEAIEAVLERVRDVEIEAHEGVGTEYYARLFRSARAQYVSV